MCDSHSLFVSLSVCLSVSLSLLIKITLFLGKLYVADQGNYRIRVVASHKPTSEDEEVFEVPDPDSQQLYVFNR